MPVESVCVSPKLTHYRQFSFAVERPPPPTGCGQRLVAPAWFRGIQVQHSTQIASVGVGLHLLLTAPALSQGEHKFQSFPLCCHPMYSRDQIVATLEFDRRAALWAATFAELFSCDHLLCQELSGHILHRSNLWSLPHKLECG